MRKARNLNAVLLGKKLTIAIDIDGTVADCSKVDFSKVNRNKNEFIKAAPITGALEAIKCLYKQGHIIVFHSSRNYASKKVTQTWLIKYGFPYIVMDKFVAHVYIDDRAINGCCRERVMQELKNPYLLGRRARRKGMKGMI